MTSAIGASADYCPPHGPIACPPAWVDPGTTGHGLTLEILDEENLLVYWFTFDNAGNPAWLIALGTHAGTTATAEALIVEGGRFPPAFNPESIQLQDWGELELEFFSCDQAELRWTTHFPGFGDGSMPLTRLSRMDDHSCIGPPPADLLRPPWFSDSFFYFRLPDSD